MKSREIRMLIKKFESASFKYEGMECWSARDLQLLLDYSQWRNFINVVDKAKSSCKNAGEKTKNHFADVSNKVGIGSGAHREVDDILLTRYACYLIAQNGDSKKKQIAFAQNYFAVQTRRAELIEQRILDYERVKARLKLAETEKMLSGILYERDINDKDFGIIRSKGDKALFKLNTSALKHKMGIPEKRPLADFLPIITIKAKDLAAEMTSVNVQVKNIRGIAPIEKEHIENNHAIRQGLLKRGIFPENLPPEEDIKKVERRLKNEEKRALLNKN